MESTAAAAGNPSKASRHDLQYHVVLARASHNGVLVHFINGMRALLEIWIDKAVNRQPVVKEVVREHNAVREALFAGDPERAASGKATAGTIIAWVMLGIVGLALLGLIIYLAQRPL